MFYDPEPLGLTIDAIMARCASLPDPIHATGKRLVIHHQTSPALIDDFVDVIRKMAEEKRQGKDVNEEGEGLTDEQRDVPGRDLRLKAATGYGAP